jgi:type II secretory pathway pseudopilin PulG
MKTRRQAFSLFELLVILAILALLLALLLPAVAKVRSAANRSKSQNNLKQLAISVHNYHDSFNVFPPGNDDNQFSAAARLLPFLEQDNLFKLIDLQKPCTDDANKQVRAVHVKVFESPNDPQGPVKPDFGPTNYLFSAGSKYGLEDNNGLFYQNSQVKIPQITDGTSNTMMIGETLRGDGGAKAEDVRRQHVLLRKDALKNLTEESGVKEFADNQHISGDRCAAWIDGRFLQGTFTGTRVMNDKKPDVSCEGFGGLSGLRSLSNVVNIAMGDGSARTVAAGVDLNVWRALASRNGGEVLPNF